MRPGQPSEPRTGNPKRLSLLVPLARAALIWERLWPALWPLAGVTGLFLAMALLDFLPFLPGWLHALLLAAFLGAAAWAARRGLSRFHLPSENQARRRLEQDSGLAHRPLTSLDDTIALGAGDGDSRRLWDAHRRRLFAQLRSLRVGAPHPGLAARDPLALRTALGLILVVALVTAQDDWPGRLKRAVTPELGALAAATPVQFDIWVNPPRYTGLPPLFLEPSQAEAAPLSVPVGSTVLAQVQGGRGQPSLIVGGESTPFVTVTLDAYKIDAEIREGDRLAIEQNGRELAAWPLALRPDGAPRIEFLSPPARSERAALRLEYQAEDDYGLTKIAAVIRRIDNPIAEPMELDLPLPGIGLQNAEGASYHDLTPHPWAGIAVTIHLTAEDALGQQGTSDPVRTVLPERIFNHPVARALVELRKQLTLNPDARKPVTGALNEIYARPDHYFNDVVVALSIRSAAQRLTYDTTPTAIAEVQKLLWDTALHIEEGELAIAERDLRDIQKKLLDALARNADDEEINRLLDQLQQALDRFLQALAEQLSEQMAEGAEAQPLPPNAQILRGSDLQKLIDRARDLAQSGARDAAREMLAQLQNMLENLRANPFSQDLNDDTRNAFDMMQDMENMLQRQQELLDRSFQRSQNGNQDGSDPAQSQQENQNDAQGQEKLRQDLGEMMRRLADALGDIPNSLGRAEQSMRGARDALEGNQSAEAVGPQTRAMDQLQQGMQAAADQFMEMFGQSAPGAMGQTGMQPGQGFDPLGRQPGNNGMGALEGVDIPDQMELRRTRQILNELRRRRGERQRPPLELDYIDRLLQQF